MVRDVVSDAVEEALREHATLDGLLILVNDPARATPTRVVLDEVFTRVPAGQCDVVVACGTHRHSDSRRRNHEHEHGLERCRSVYWHDAERPARTISMLVPERAVLGIGSVEPHWFAGWTGAHKTLTVGVWSQQAITANHRFAMEPAAQPCRLRGNPVYEGLIEALEGWSSARRGPVSVVNVVIGPAGIVAAAGGAPRGALERLVPVASEVFTERVPRALDRLVARVAPPLDRSLYQALKGVKNHAGAVRDGGALVLVAMCEDGVGIHHFLDQLAAVPDYEAMRERLGREGYQLGDHKALRLLELVEKRGLQLAIVSRGLDDAAATACRMRRFGDEGKALRWARHVAPGGNERVVEDAAQRVTLVG